MFSILSRSVLNVKALVGTFNQEKAIVGAFFMIVISLRTLVWSFTANHPLGAALPPSPLPAGPADQTGAAAGLDPAFCLAAELIISPN